MFKKLLLILLLIVVVSRIIYLNYYSNKYHIKYNNKIYIYIEGPTAKRGRILDINGNVLADDRAVKTIFYHRIDNVDELGIANKLAELIEIEEDPSEMALKKYYLLKNKDESNSLITDEEYKLYEKRKYTSDEIYDLKIKRISESALNSLTPMERKIAYIYDLMQKGYSYDNKIIKKNVDEQEYAKVLEANISGIFGGITWERVYPNGETFKQIIGSVGNITKENKSDYLKDGYSLSDTVGTSYLELEYEKYLRGSKSVYKVEKNNILKLYQKEKSGNDLVLNIDLDIQKKLDEILKDNIIKTKKDKNTGYFKESYAVISNPSSGAIIAMSGQRYLNDNSFMDVTSNIINNSYTVGSVVKGATITVGYNNHIIDENTKVVDSCVKLYLVPEKCSYKRLGVLNDIKALKESSNYFQFLIAIGLTNNKYYYNIKINATKENFDEYRKTLADYGLGELSGIDLPNEKEGIKGKIVSDDLLLNLAIGQYDTYTPIMLSKYINTIASNGYVKTPILLNRVVDGEKVIYKPNNDPIRKVTIEDKYLERIRTGFNLVTTQGTARGYINNSINRAGKTGTSESFYDSDNDQIADAKTITTSFAGFFPFDDPKYSIVLISPNISNYKDNDYYISGINRRISKDISDYLIKK